MKGNNLPAIWIIGFPKSGNTWISYLCSYCFNLPFHNYGDLGGSPKNPRVIMKTKGENDWKSVDRFHSIQKTHKLPDSVPYQNGIVFYIIRDPRDVFVSYSFFMISKNSRLRGRIKYHMIKLFGRRFQINRFLANWEIHIKKWIDKSSIIINYEQLLNEGDKYLEKLFKSASLDVPNEIIKDALEYFSFEKMSGGRKPGVEKQSNFFRKGISGDWKNHMNENELILFNKSIKYFEDIIN